jgi:ABC-type uncharacterized transport system ATPase subunit
VTRRSERPPSGTPVLRAEVAVSPAHPVTCASGEVALLPDDEALVAALVGEDHTRDHRIELAGKRVDRRSPAGRVRAGLAVVRGSEVAGDVSVRDHLVGACGRRRAAELLDGTPLLAARGDDPAGVLSGGERRVLGWLLAVAAEPRAVVLDRAGTGLDIVSLRWAHHVVDRWVDAGVAVLLRAGRPEEARWASHRADGSQRSGADARRPSPPEGGPAPGPDGRP